MHKHNNENISCNNYVNINIIGTTKVSYSNSDLHWHIKTSFKSFWQRAERYRW